MTGTAIKTNGEQRFALALWRQGVDTVDIAQRLRVPEYEVYRIVSGRPRTAPQPSLNIPYAGAPR